MLFNMAVSLYTSRVVLATLGIDDYGLNAVVTSVVTMFSFINSSMANATSRFFSVELSDSGGFNKLKQTFSSVLTVHFLIAILVLCLGETIGLWWLEHEAVIPQERMTAARWVYQISIITSVLTIIQTPYNSAIMSHEKMNVYAYIEIAKTSLKLIIVYLLIIGHFDKLILYAFLTLAVTIIISIVYYVYCVKHFEECRYKFTWNKDIIKHVVSFSGWDLFGNLGNFAKLNGLNIILNLFFLSYVNAAFAISFQVRSVLSPLAYSILLSFTPQIIKYYADDNIQQMQNLMNNAVKFSSCLLFLAVLPIILDTDFVLHLWLGDKVPAFTNIFVKLYLISILMENISNLLFRPIHADGRLKKMTISTFVVDMIVIFSSYFFYKYTKSFPPFCLIMVNLSFIVIIAIKLILIGYQIKRYSIRDFIHNGMLVVFKIFLLSSILPVMTILLLDEGLFRFIILMTVFILSLGFFFFRLALTHQMRIKIIQGISSKLNFGK